uniref:C2H2-type domain-containing protein n=1 Tax=Bursaphelenchus xylophilus TaxID=6326 RepID=A0A1I7S1Q4_BURXY
MFLHIPRAYRPADRFYQSISGCGDLRHELFICFSDNKNFADSVPTSTTTPKEEPRAPNKTPTTTISSSTSLQNLLNATANLPNFADAIAAIVQQQAQQQQLLLQQQLQQQQQKAISNILGVGAQNTLILPVAYHSQSDPSVIQVVGPAQTIIPVAISRQVPVTSRSLLLDSAFASQLQLPIHGKFPLNPQAGEFGLPLAFVHQLNSQNGPSTSNGNVTATATILSGTELNPTLLGRKRMRTSSSSSSSKRFCDSAESSSRPLDLSQKNGPKEEDKANAEAKKPFACDCGVAFMSKETLTSHRKYYCKNRVTIEEIEEMEPARKVPSRCSQCDYVPATHAQLAQHIRHKHSLVQAFVCLLCGYKGYSARGIKNHLRTSHGDEMSKRRADNESQMLSDKSLLQDYVFCVTADTKQLQCEKCRLTFPTDDLMKRHQCRAAEN